MIKIKEAIIVEGRYDKNTISQIVDAPIIETSGFAVFKDEEKISLLRSLAEKRGIIIFTDSDGAGFVIRGHLKGKINSGTVKHAYIPEIEGKEKRKASASKEGLLGVEGMSPSIIIEALRRAGATFEGSEEITKGDTITKADFYEIGLSGCLGSNEKRKKLLEFLGYPQKMSSNSLLEVLNAVYERDEFLILAADILNAD